MRLYVATMDAVLLDFRPDGTVLFEGEEWTRPSLQETRAILHAATEEIEKLTELTEVLGKNPA
jgi:hypothetical protein